MGSLLSGRLPLPPLRCRFRCSLAAPSCCFSAATCPKSLLSAADSCSPHGVIIPDGPKMPTSHYKMTDRER